MDLPFQFQLSNFDNVHQNFKFLKNKGRGAPELNLELKGSHRIVYGGCDCGNRSFTFVKNPNRL